MDFPIPHVVHPAHNVGMIVIIEGINEIPIISEGHTK